MYIIAMFLDSLFVNNELLFLLRVKGYNQIIIKKEPCRLTYAKKQLPASGGERRESYTANNLAADRR